MNKNVNFVPKKSNHIKVIAIYQKWIEGEKEEMELIRS